jgi:hypothetical protein
MVLYDVGTGYLDCFPTNTKSTAEAIQALQNFLGPRQPVGLFHSDAARELFAAAKAIGLCKSSSPPARPVGNGLAESKVRKVLEGSRTIMEHAGMDPKYWSFACKHFCFCYNHTKGVSKGAERQEPIFGRRLPDGYSIPNLIPFGCLVDFLPSPVHQRKFPKWSGKAKPGILLSYNTSPGGRWKGEYAVAILEDFQNKESKPQIHTVLEVIPAKTKDGEFIFPLKEEYEKRRNVVSASKIANGVGLVVVENELML